MRLNTALARPMIKTHEGAPAKRITAEQQLRRSVLSCMLFEKEAYEDGKPIASRIVEHANAVPLETLAALAVEARQEAHLRHVPLLLASVLALRSKGTSLVPDTLEQVIGRADELAEFLAVFANTTGTGPDKLKTVMTHGVRKGLARAIKKFDAYQLAKWSKDGPIKLRDVLFLTHPKPESDEQKALWDSVVNGTLEPPATWEVALSGGADKKATFEGMLREGTLGYMALLRNLRGMMDAGVDRDLVAQSILARKGARQVLPFRYVAAARACPQLEPYIDQALVDAVGQGFRFPGRTVILVDVSGSMDTRLSAKSDLTRADAAAAIASVFNGDRRVFTFSNGVIEVPARTGMAGIEAILRSQPHGRTYLGRAVAHINANVPHDRLIVVTDEQSADRVPDPLAQNAYMVNVASAQNGVGYGIWRHMDGFSESVLKWIAAVEAE